MRVFFLFSLVFSTFYSSAQFSEYLQRVELEELVLLKNGYVLIPLNGDVNNQENTAIKNAFKEKFLFADFYFFKEEESKQPNTNLPLEVLDRNNEELKIDFDTNQVFVIHFYQEAFEHREQYNIVKNKESTDMESLPTVVPKNSYEAELLKFSPQNPYHGGIVLEKFTPLVIRLNRRKRLISNHYFFSRFHQELKIEIKYARCVEHIQYLLEEKEKELAKFN